MEQKYLVEVDETFEKLILAIDKVNIDNFCFVIFSFNRENITNELQFISEIQHEYGVNVNWIDCSKLYKEYINSSLKLTDEECILAIQNIKAFYKQIYCKRLDLVVLSEHTIQQLISDY